MSEYHASAKSSPHSVIVMARGYRVLGAAEIAVRLGITRQRAYQLVNTKGFPDPRFHLAMGQVWDGDDIEEWIRRARPELAGDGD